jgi:hypothetical protein
MVKDLPPLRPEPELATPEEIVRARDADASAELVATSLEVERGPRGLAVGIHIDLRPTTRLLEAIVRALRAGAAPAPLPSAEVDDDDPPVT